jgi:diguanylate cyclase (GGDEF)-like protein/PAS domain S-box-containing protein
MAAAVDDSLLELHWSSVWALTFEVGESARLLALSPPLAELLGHADPTKILGSNVGPLFADRSLPTRLLNELVHGRPAEEVGLDLLDATGKAVTLLGSASITTGGAVCLVVRDPRARRADLEAREMEYSRLRALVEGAADVVYRTDLEGRFVYINPAGASLLGWSAEELAGMGWIEIVREDAVAAARRFYLRQRRSAEVNTYYEVPIRTRAGSDVWLGQNVQLVYEGGESIGYQAFAREITDRKLREESLTHRATHDSLTRVFNRSFFETRVERKIADSVRNGSRGALMIIDLDRFKEVNDRFGHRLGDVYLAGFGKLLQRRFRESDVVARIGGDEFAVLLDRPRSDKLEDLAQELLVRIRYYAATADERASTTASIGIALFPDHGATRDDIMSRADFAMYSAKEAGGNRYHVYAPSEPDAVDEQAGRARRVDQVRGALDRRDFELVAQPVVSLIDASVLFHEILLRLRAADGRLIEAGSFLGMAGRVGSMQEIDCWVVERVFDDLARLGDPGDLVLGVNLSGASVGDDEVLALVRDRLAHSSLDPSRLIFEVTESAAIADLERAVEFMGSLCRLGCRFALDDFGVGFSSLYRLKELPVELLKIDGNFVRGLAVDGADRALVRAIVEVANVLGKRTIAELVEDEETVTALREAGVDYAQGFHVGRSRPLEEILTSPTRAGAR